MASAGQSHHNITGMGMTSVFVKSCWQPPPAQTAGVATPSWWSLLQLCSVCEPLVCWDYSLGENRIKLSLTFFLPIALTMSPFPGYGPICASCLSWVRNWDRTLVLQVAAKSSIQWRPRARPLPGPAGLAWPPAPSWLRTGRKSRKDPWE